MATTPFPVETFGGLDLVSNPNNLAGNAVDLLDVDFPSAGVIRSRPGLTQLGSSSPSSTGYQAIYPTTLLGGCFILVRTNGTNNPIDLVGPGGYGNVGTFTSGAGAVPVSFASLGTPSSSLVYFTIYNYGGSPSGYTIGKTDGSTVSTGTGKPRFVATWPTSNRLVQGCYRIAADSPSGANGSESTVFFSDPGAPDTYTANNFVTLRPGDGEVIVSIVAWRELLFVFKQSSVFVFYGESTDGDGNPVFNYRRVDLPTPIQLPTAPTAYAPPACAGPDGVFYGTRAGVYALAGSTPERISSPIDPVFRSDTSVSSSVRSDPRFNPVLSIAGNRLFATYVTISAGARTLVFNFLTKQWSLWTVPGGYVYASWPVLSGSTASTYVLPADEFATTYGNFIGLMDPMTSTDAGAAIAWSYTSGGYAPGGPGHVAISLESKLVGSGTATMKVATRGAGSSSGGVFDTGSAVAMGTYPVDDEGWQQIDREGTQWQHKLSGTGGVSISRLVHYLSFTKPSGVG